MTTMGGTTRYSCPLPNCGWERDTPPDEGPMVVELALRGHANEHSVLEYLRALIGARQLPMEPDGDYADHEAFWVVGRWGVDGNTTRAQAVRRARKALIEYPGCEARVDRCVTRTWDDGSQFIGASETIDLDGEPE